MKKYEVKAVKTFIGNEGRGFNATLYCDGKKVGLVADSAYGGCLDYYLDKGQRTILEDHCKTLPKEKSLFGDEMEHVDSDTFIYRLVDIFQDNKSFKRKSKTKTIVLLHSGKDGESLEYNDVFNESIIEFIKKEHGADLKEIVNYRFMTPVSDHDKHKKACQKKTLFTINSDESDRWRIINSIYSPELKARLTVKFGSDLKEIINERYI